MRSLTDGERRTIRLAGAALATYLVVYGVVLGRGWLGERRQQVAAVQRDILALEAEVLSESKAARRYRTLREEWALASSEIPPTRLVSEVREAIESSAEELDLTIGSSRENTARGIRERAVVQLDVTGDSAKVWRFLQGIREHGLPVLLDRFVLERQEAPGVLKVMLRLRIVDRQAWEGARRA